MVGALNRLPTRATFDRQDTLHNWRQARAIEMMPETNEGEAW